MAHRDEMALLRAVRESPHDRLPLRLYADALEDRGDPLAEFIRVGLALEDAPNDPDLLARQEELCRHHQAEWLAPLAGLAARAEPARGLFKAHMTPHVFLDNLDRLGIAPALGRVFLQSQDAFPRGLLAVIESDSAAAATGLLGGVDLGYLDDHDLRALAGFVPASRLLVLCANYADLSEEGGTILAEARFATSLEELRLGYWEGVSRLVTSGSLPSLRTLELSHPADFSPADLARLAIALSQTLPACRVTGGDAPTDHLARQLHDWLTGASNELDLSATCAGAEALIDVLEVIGAAPEASRVSSLRLRRMGLWAYDRILKALDASPGFDALACLDMGGHYGDMGCHSGEMGGSVNLCVSGVLGRGGLPPLPRLAARLQEIIVPREDDDYGDEERVFTEQHRPVLQRALPRTRIRIESMMNGDVR